LRGQRPAVFGSSRSFVLTCVATQSRVTAHPVWVLGNSKIRVFLGRRQQKTRQTSDGFFTL